MHFTKPSFFGEALVRPLVGLWQVVRYLHPAAGKVPEDCRLLSFIGGMEKDVSVQSHPSEQLQKRCFLPGFNRECAVIQGSPWAQNHLAPELPAVFQPKRVYHKERRKKMIQIDKVGIQFLYLLFYPRRFQVSLGQVFHLKIRMQIGKPAPRRYPFIRGTLSVIRIRRQNVDIEFVLK